MQLSPGIFVHLDLCGDWLGPAGQSAFIVLPRSAGVARKENGAGIQAVRAAVTGA